MPLLDIFKHKKKPVKSEKPAKSKTKIGTAKKKVKSKTKTLVSDRAYRVLINPLVTEKATNLSAQNKYVFKVAMKATKREIKKAIEEIYGIRPQAVHIIKVHGKHKKYGRTEGRTSDWKKAIITLKPGDKIEIVEGV